MNELGKFEAGKEEGRKGERRQNRDFLIVIEGMGDYCI